MKIQRGDTVFGADGKPAIVQGRDTLTGRLTVDRGGPEYEKTRKMGFINGLRPGEREVFTTAMDKVRGEESPQKKLQALTEIINDLQNDPHNLQLVRYLESEKAHLMYTERIFPRTYTIDALKVQT